MFAWTPENIEKLIVLAKEGYSGGHIADAIGAQSRSAVLGKIHRLGLRLAGKQGGERSLRQGKAASPKSPVSKPRKRAKRLPSRLLANMSSSIAPDEGVEPVPQCPPVPNDTREEPVAVSPDSDPLLIFALTANVCRWPLWNTDDDLGVGEKLYCGALTAGETYCSHHRAVASQHDYSHSERAAYRAKQRANA